MPTLPRNSTAKRGGPRTFVLWLLFALLLAACETAGDVADDIGAAGDEEQPALPTATPIPTAEAVARPTYTVQRGTVQNSLEFTGRWEPRDQLDLSFEISGAVRQVPARRGETVAQGQLLADLQIDELEAQLEQARLDLETAQENLDSGGDTSNQTVEDLRIQLANARIQFENLNATRDWTSVANARINLDSAWRQLDNAQREYDEARSQPDQPADIVDQARQALESAQENVRTAQNQYSAAAQAYNSQEFNIQQQQNNVIQAELALERAQERGTDPNAEQAVRSAQLRIDQLEADIAQSSLFAPFDGVILDVSISPGDPVQAFEDVMTIGQPAPLEVIAQLPIGDAQRLSVGLVGVCNIINLPESAVQCAARQIPQSAQSADQTTRVAASLDNVQQGQLIEVEMPLEVREDVLWLPPAAIRTFQQRTFVVLETPQGERSADVQLGLQTDDRVEIISGVEEGDIVIGP
ncbi:MAG: HlyD family efflux transporter periplasmic adaptor subunit [Anaerolineales bacterium]